MKSVLRGTILLLVALMLVTGCSKEQSVDLNGTVVDPPFVPASDVLRTTDGSPYALTKDTTAALTLVFFGYTHCPDICPAVLASISSGLAKLTAAQRKQVDVLFVTSDPKRDTGPVMRSYLDRFDPGYIGLTGDLAAIARVGKSVGVFVDEGAALADGGYDPNSHSAYVIGINAQHVAPIFWGGDTAPSQFANDIRFLLTEKPEKLKAATTGSATN